MWNDIFLRLFILLIKNKRNYWIPINIEKNIIIYVYDSTIHSAFRQAFMLYHGIVIKSECLNIPYLHIFPGLEVLHFTKILTDKEMKKTGYKHLKIGTNGFYLKDSNI